MPWYLNGTLPKGEREVVRAHLQHCERCQAELRETRQAAEVFGAHIAPQVLLDLAWEHTLPAEDARTAERHLESCRDCADELAAARESRAVAARPENVVPLRPVRRLPAWVGAGLAACLVLGFAVGQRWDASRQDAQLRAERERGQAASARAEELAGASARAQGLEQRLGALLQPQTDASFVELLPREVRRGAASGTLARLQPQGVFSVLSLVADAPQSYEAYRLTALAADGRTLWQSSDLKRQPTGEFLLLVPSERLLPGRTELRLEGRRGERWSLLASYALDVRPAAR